MFKIFVLYKKPPDEAAFMRYYDDVHIPLVHKIPGLQEAVVNPITSELGGGSSAYFVITELRFASCTDADRALASDEFAAAGGDLDNFAKGLVTLLVSES